MLNKMKKMNMVKMFGIGSLCLFLLGCSNESFLLKQEDSLVNTGMTEELQMQEKMQENLQKKTNITVQKEVNETIPKETNEEVKAISEEAEPKIEIAVHICGAVNQPGVYIFQRKSRIYEGIQKAGGFTGEAAKDYLNLALPLEDGMKIEVPTEEMLKNRNENTIEEAVGISYGGGEKKASMENENDGKVNLNTADATLLCTLPGIGESKAKSIIAYREEHGAFQKTEDIMKIPGIKEAAYEKIKDLVKVS